MPPLPIDPKTRAEMPAQDAVYCRGILIEVGDMGAEPAQLLVQQAKAAVATPAPAGSMAPDFTNAFGRVSRWVRRSKMLAQRFTAPENGPSGPGAE